MLDRDGSAVGDRSYAPVHPKAIQNVTKTLNHTQEKLPAGRCLTDASGRGDDLGDSDSKRAAFSDTETETTTSPNSILEA